MLSDALGVELVRLVDHGKRVEEGLNGLDQRIRLALGSADPARLPPSASDCHSFLALEMARRIGTMSLDSKSARDALFDVAARWFDQPLPRDPAQRKAAIAQLPELSDLVDCVRMS